jgi:uncharacterized protein
MRELVEQIAKALVDKPDKVQVRAIEGEWVTVFEISADPSDIGKIVGKHGRTVGSIRTILDAVSMKIKRRLKVEVLGPSHLQ